MNFHKTWWIHQTYVPQCMCEQRKTSKSIARVELTICRMCHAQLWMHPILCFIMASHNAGQSVWKYIDFLLANTLSRQTYSTITAIWFCILQPSLLTDLYWLKVCSGISWSCETFALCSVYSDFSRCAASTYMFEHHNRHQHTVEASRAYKSLFYSKYVAKST